MPPPPDALQPSAPAASPWHFGALDPDDATAVAAYEQSLFQAFHPILQKNPLVRHLWEWDDARQRLRTRVPYADQYVALMRHAHTGALAFSVGVNLAPAKFWQSGAYHFPVPAPEEHACEFLIMAGSQSTPADGALILRHFIRGHFFAELRRRGFQRAYGTSADHLRFLYRRVGATIAAENTIGGFRRTLFRWEMGSPE